jgi:RNA polymerase sigma-70 factor (ECF subfamily)
MSNRNQALLAELPRLRRYARTLAGDPSQADDLVQDCLERAVANLDRWREGTNMRAWLFTIMRNVLFNDLRRARRSPFLDTTAEAIDSIAVRADQDSRMRIEEIDRAFAHLKADQRAVVLLIAVEGFDYEEAAGVLGVPVGTVKSRLSRARADLRRLMARDDPAQSPPAPRSGWPPRFAEPRCGP